MSVSSEESFVNPGWFKSKEYRFFSIERDNDYQFSNGSFQEEDVLASFIFKLDEKKMNYSRAIYNVLDLLGDVGGLMDAL